MARINAPLVVFNRGRISNLGLARVDLDRTRLSAEVQTNWIPRVLGSMMLRPGLQYIGEIRNNSTAVLIPFIFSTTDTALFELTSTAMRVWTNDALVERVNSTAVIANSSFTSNLTSWTDADESGSTSEFVTGGFLGLTGTRFARAIRRQTVTSSSGVHGVTTVIDRGRVNLRIGSSVGADDYVNERTLRRGTYSFAVTTTGNFFIELSANTAYRSRVDSISVDSSGALVLPSTWSSSDLSLVRWDQSRDVVFTACPGFVQKRIERYGSESYALVDYEPEDGPFATPNVTNKQLTPSALSGDITLECDKPFFDAGHVGALFRITSIGQSVTITPSAADQFSDAIRVSGVQGGRIFDHLVESSTGFVATVRIQRSVGSSASFSNVAGLVFTTTESGTHDDTLDNQIIYYRIGVGSTYTSGSPICTLTYTAGGITGVCKIRSVVSATESSASVLTNMGSTDSSELWQEGDWSTLRGFPTSVVLHEGRLWWAGKGKTWGSISDAFEGWNPDFEGDAGPINRSIASGGVDNIPWMGSLGRLIVGTDAREFQVKTGALEEPLTPTNFSLRDISSQGSANVPSVRVDKRQLFVQQGGVRIFETAYSGQSLDYESAERSILVPEIGEPSIVRMAVQRQPDTRVHCVRGATDGTVAVLVSDPAENVNAWVDINTEGGVNGAIEDCAVLPTNTIEDAVYYIVRRDINGSTRRSLERMAREDEARGGSSNRMADSFKVQNSTATTLVTSATHLAGSSIIAWGATADLGSYTVSTDGEFTLSQAATTVCYGLPYSGTFVSAKLAYAAEAGTALTQRKRISHVGVVLADVHAQGLQYGTSTGNLDPLPLVKGGSTISTDEVFSAFDEQPIEFPGEWNTDSRIVLQATAPRPVTVLGAVINIETKEKR